MLCRAPQHGCWLELDAHGAAPCCTAARCTRECYQDCSDVRGWGEFNRMGSLFLGYSSLGRAVLCQTCANSALGWRVSSYSKGLSSVGGREKVSLHSLKWGLIMSCLQVCQPPPLESKSIFLHWPFFPISIVNVSRATGVSGKMEVKSNCWLSYFRYCVLFSIL